MGSFGQVSFQAIRRMLADCAPGSVIREKQHRQWVLYNGRTFRGLPKGRHGKNDPEIEVGHIKQMINQLGINRECAERHLPAIK